MAVSGTRKMKRTFRRLPDEMQKRIQKAINQGAEDILDTALLFAPVLTGATSGSGHTKYIPQQFAAEVIFDDLAARFVEFGTRPRQKGVVNITSAPGAPVFRGRKSGNTHPGSHPSPFLFPAYRSQRRRVRARIARATREAAKHVAGV